MLKQTTYSHTCQSQHHTDGELLLFLTEELHQRFHVVLDILHHQVDLVHVRADDDLLKRMMLLVVIDGNCRAYPSVDYVGMSAALQQHVDLAEGSDREALPLLLHLKTLQRHHLV